MKRVALVPVTTLALLILTGAEATAQGFRSAYCQPGIYAWTPSVDLPSLMILDLGRDLKPLAVNDAGTVVAMRADSSLVRVEPGRVDTLLTRFSSNGQAFINNNGYIVANIGNDFAPPVHIWRDLGQHTELDWSGQLFGDREYTRVCGLNDRDQLVLQASSSRQVFLPFPHEYEYVTNKVDLRSYHWQELTSHQSILHMDFSMTVSGTFLDVYSLNDYGETVGHVRNEEGTSMPGSPVTYSLQEDYYAYGTSRALSYFPMSISQYGTIVGSTFGPTYSLVIEDAAGARPITEHINLLESRNALISSPEDRMEEIILGPRYWKRCSQRNSSGQPTSIPSDEFFETTLNQIISNSDGWTDIEATCISKEGSIAGFGYRRDPLTANWELHGFVLMPAGMVIDGNRDGSIDAADRGLPEPRRILRLWINDDDDSGQEARSWKDDAPEASSPDHANPGVDGLRDLVDFMPVHLDLQRVLQSLTDPSSVQLRLRQSDGAFNLVYSDLLPGEVGSVHGDIQSARFGSSFDQLFEAAETVPVTPEGVLLERSFFDNLRSANRGVLFVEATAKSARPLVLDILRGGEVVGSTELRVSTSPVRDMFRVVNLRNADSKFASANPGPWGTNLHNPSNLPDSLLVGQAAKPATLIHVHGFNWSGDEIIAGHAEVFKRFHQAGSMARFIGLTWRGDEGTFNLTGGSFDYNENVINAFITASYLPEALQGWVDQRTAIFAHSLGNMVTSSSIVDFGLRPGAYFMLNAAVPVEAFTGEVANREDMVNPAWKDIGLSKSDYAEFLLSANWSRLFDPASDHRALITWKNRFYGISDLVNCYNFFSSGEEILKTGDGHLPGIFSDLARREEIWVFNEMVKGTSHLSSLLTADVQGGWGFNSFYMTAVHGGAHNPGITYRKMSTSQANSLNPDGLISQPFFDSFSRGDSDFPLWGDGSWLYADSITANLCLPDLPLAGQPIELIKNHAKLLAEAIPAHSPPAGSNPLGANSNKIKDLDLNENARVPSFWPPRTIPEVKSRWLHSDYLDTAFAQCSKLYRLCVEIMKTTL